MEVRRTFYEQLALYDHLQVEHGALAPVTQADALAEHGESHRYDRVDHVHADEAYTDAELRVESPRSVGAVYARWAARQDQQNRVAA